MSYERKNKLSNIYDGRGGRVIAEVHVTPNQTYEGWFKIAKGDQATGEETYYPVKMIGRRWFSCSDKDVSRETIAAMEKDWQR